MKFVTGSPFADPDAAARKLVELGRPAGESRICGLLVRAQGNN
jgi:hypothetical protein